MPKPASLQARATGAAIRRELDVRPYLPYARHVTDRIVALDTRALMLSFCLDGASFETADVRDLNDWHAKLNGAWRNIASDRLAVWHHPRCHVQFAAPDRHRHSASAGLRTGEFRPG